MDGQPMRIGPCQNCHDDPCTCEGQYGENPITPLHELQTARIAELENQLAEALKYGAPKNSKALSFVTHPCNFHSHYWTTMSGSCMACRAVSAETERDELRKQLADLRGDAARYRTLRSTLQTDGSFDIGEAYLKLKVVGAYPEDSDWDATIDALAAQSAKEKI